MTPERFGAGSSGERPRSPGPDQDPPLDPQEESVRRLLAASAEPAQLPSDVADRLDTVLAGLVAERASPQQAGSTLANDLQPRRARRWPRVLVAAATVSVVAWGVTNVVQETGGMDAGSGGGGLAESPEAASRAEGSARPESGEAGPEATERAPSADAGGGSAVELPTVRTRTLAADARRIAASSFPRVPSSPAQAAIGCAIPRTPQGPPQGETGGSRVAAVRLDGQPAVMVIGPVVDGQRRVRVYDCLPPDAAGQDAEGLGAGGRLLASVRIRP